MRIGYGRVSTRDQNPDAQRDALTAAGCDQVVIDKASGKLARRPELDKALLSASRTGDQLVATKLDRLGRSLDHLISLSKHLQASGIDLVVLDQGIDTSTAVGRMFFQILGDRRGEANLIRQRTSEGMAIARDRGKQPKLSPAQAREVHRMHTSGDYAIAQIAELFSVSRPTIYRALQRTTASAVLPADTRPLSDVTKYDAIAAPGLVTVRGGAIQVAPRRLDTHRGGSAAS